MELTYNQIKAINDAMSFLTTIWCIKDVSRLKEHVARHYKQMVDAKVDKNIIDHFDAIMHSHISYIEEYGPHCD